MISLAYFIKKNYGSTMNQALRTVLPVKKSANPVQEKFITLLADDNKVRKLLKSILKIKEALLSSGC